MHRCKGCCEGKRTAVLRASQIAALSGLRQVQRYLHIFTHAHVCNTAAQSPGIIWCGLYWQGKFAISNLPLKKPHTITALFAEVIWELRSSMNPLELRFLLLALARACQRPPCFPLQQVFAFARQKEIQGLPLEELRARSSLG